MAWVHEIADRPSERDQMLGKIECVFSLYDKMRWKWNDVYLLWGLPNIYSPSLCPGPLPLYISTPAIAVSRCTWRVWSSKFGDALVGRDRANSEAVIERVERYTCRLWSSAFGDALGGCDRANLEIHLEAVFEQAWRCTWRMWSSNFGEALGGCDRETLGIHLEAVIERV